MVSKIDTTVGYQGRVSELSCNEFADGTIAPRGCQLLSSFRLDQYTAVHDGLAGGYSYSTDMNPTIGVRYAF